MASVVLIPGLLCDRGLWRGQQAQLAKFADIVLPDLTDGSTIEEMAAAVLRQCPECFSLVGFSLGSQIALEIVRTFARRVERLALLSATHSGLLPATAAAIRRAIQVIEHQSLESYLDEAYPTYVAPRRINDIFLKRIFVAMAQSVGIKAGLRQMRALLEIKTAFPSLDHIRCPTLILGGGQDQRTPPSAHQSLHQQMPGSELLIIDDAGHFTPIEQPQIVAEALQRWLTH